MTPTLFDQPLDLLERRFQALQERAAGLPEVARSELETALQGLSQAIAALRADREAGESPPAAAPGRGEALLGHVFNAIPDLLTIIDRDFNIVMSNWHRPEVPEEMRRGQPKCYRVYHRRDRPCEDCHVPKVFATGQPLKVEKTNDFDGRVLEISVFPIQDESGQVSMVVEHVRDIQERYLAEKALRESEDRFRTLIEDSPESLFLTDTQGTILAASRVAARRLEKNLAEVIGALLFDLFPPEVAARRRDVFDQAVATGRPVRLEDKRGGIHFDVNINPILDADGKVSRLSILGIDITDRKNTEQALKDSEATLRTLIEANSESLFLLDSRGVILAASHVAAQRLGKSLEEIIGTDLHGMLPPEVSKKRDEIVQGVVATGQPARFEDVRGDFYFDSSITPIFDRDKVVQVAVLGVDISLRKLTEQALKDSEARFRAIFATAQDSIFIKDRSFRYTQVNPAMERLYGRSAAEIIGMTDSDLVGEADTERIRKQDRRVLNGEVVKGAHTATVQGVPITFHYIKAPLHDDAGEIVGICGIARDITDLKRAEAALKESEERFRMLFEHAPDAYILADMQGEIIDCNQATEELAGYGREELIGNNFACLPWLDFRHQVRLADLLAQTARGEVMGPVDFTLTRKDGGEVIAEGMSLPLYIQGQNLVLTIIRDITARKQAEEELFKNHAELQETAQRLELSRNMLHLIIESIPVRVFWKDRDLRYIGCNTLFARDAGFDHPEQLLGQDDFAMGWREQAHLYTMDDRQVMESLRPKMNFVEPQTTPAGAKIWLKTSKVPLQMPNGEAFGVLGVYEDITPHKQAEEALRESEERFRHISSTISDISYSCTVGPNASHALDWLAGAAERITGYSVEEIMAQGCWNFLVLEADQPLFEQLITGLAVGSSGNCELRLRHKNGEVVWVAAFAKLVQEPDQSERLHIYGGLVDITARKQAEAALKESEERYRALFEASPDAINVMDLEMNFLMANQRGEQLFGHGRIEEAMPQKGLDYVAPEERPRVIAAITDLLETGQTQTFEVTMLKQDGTRFRCLASNTLIRDAAGHPQAILGVARDITALKRAEAGLRKSEELFRSLVEHITLGITLISSDYRIIMTNPAQGNLFHKHPREFVNKECFREFEKRPAVCPHCPGAIAMATGQKAEVETRGVRDDGSTLVGRILAFPSFGPDGEVNGFIEVVEDITQSKQVEVALRESEQRFRLMAETIQDVFWIATPRIDKTVYVSPGFEYIWGRTREALYHNPKLFLETVHPEDRERVKSEIIAARVQSIPWNHEYRIIRPDSTVRWIQNRGFPIRNDQGRVTLFTGVATDITEHKALEGQLLQAQKMEAVGRLAGGVAHDFNNLLMAITGYGELMRTKILKDDPLYGHLENILMAGDRAAALTQQLLTFSRRQIVHLQVVDLNRVILDLEPMLGRLIGEDLHLEVVTDQRPEVVKADPGQLGQIIMNLVVNARDAMPQGGRLTLKTAPVEFKNSHHTRFGQVPPGAYVMLVAADTGVGMDEAIQAHVFEPFFTTKEQGKGTGLGLSTVYGIVKQSGGYLDLASEPGAGSTFTIYLPRLESAAEPPKAKISTTASFRGEETVLLVEDEDVLRGLLAKFLRLYGYTVLEARHGGEALLTCERHPGPIHLMVTDVVMPQMSGRELADRLSLLRPDMKIIYMSGYTEDALVQHGVANLSVAFLQKPFKPIELARRVHAVLHPPMSQ